MPRRWKITRHANLKFKEIENVDVNVNEHNNGSDNNNFN